MDGSSSKSCPVAGDFNTSVLVSKLHNEELHNLYSSPSIIRMIKSRRMRWAGHAARMGKKRNICRILVGKPEGKRPLRRPRHRWWIILKWILERSDGVVWCGLDRFGSG
jgi:hypothetical protein